MKFNATTLYSVDYGTRDALDRIVTKTETIQGETHTWRYGYDSLNRPSDVSKDGVAISHYDYDANGNRLTAPSASPVYDPQERLTSYESCTYAYRPDGSLQANTCPDGTTSYDYDAFGNLRHVTLPNGTAIHYLIDGQNRRVGKKVNEVMVEGGSSRPPRRWRAPGATRLCFASRSFAFRTEGTGDPQTAFDKVPEVHSGTQGQDRGRNRGVGSTDDAAGELDRETPSFRRNGDGAE